jgi:hypothetical protein
MQKVLRLSHRFGSLNAQFQLNKARNAVRFEAQNLLWDYEETNYHAQAFTKGLASLQFQAGSPSLTQAITSLSRSPPINKLSLSLPKQVLPTWEPISFFLLPHQKQN